MKEMLIILYICDTLECCFPSGIMQLTLACLDKLTSPWCCGLICREWAQLHREVFLSIQAKLTCTLTEYKRKGEANLNILAWFELLISISSPKIYIAYHNLSQMFKLQCSQFA